MDYLLPMKLYESNVEGINIMKDNETIIATSEAKKEMYHVLKSYIGWEFNEAEESFSYSDGSVSYKMKFNSSKFNEREYISDINGILGIYLDGKLIATYSIRPDDKFWFDISTHAKLLQVIASIEGKFDDYMQPVVEAFGESIDNGMAYLRQEDRRSVYELV